MGWQKKTDLYHKIESDKIEKNKVEKNKIDNHKIEIINKEKHKIEKKDRKPNKFIKKLFWLKKNNFLVLNDPF